jgi:hypothetical protein
MKKLLALGLLAAVVQGAAGTMARAVDPDEVQRAVDRGVEGLRRMQDGEGKWPHSQIGATALAGLALLECGVGADDKAIQRAAEAVRRASYLEKHTYSISLSILFLDRLGDPADVPLIESLTVRLLGGQGNDGGWTYDCPGISTEDQRRLKTRVDESKELRGRRELPKPGETKRTVKDLPEEIRRQLEAIDRGEAAPATPPGAAVPGDPTLGLSRAGFPSDNSNTQFAALALWVGRRYGLPVEKAVTRLDQRFRRSQMQDGTWTYTILAPPPGAPEMMIQMHMKMSASAAMTCAGVMVLAIADGATLEYVKDRKPEAKLPDVSKDDNLKRGLQALSEVIENPQTVRNAPPALPVPPGGFPPGVGGPPPGGAGRPERVGGRTYYFLWSLERAAVALGLDTIGKKDWYGWGAEVILANQDRDGMWHGAYDDCGADTAFALLFLKRANFARDLTAQLKGKVRDPGERMIRAGGVGGAGLRGGKGGLKSGLESKDARPIAKPLQSADPETTKLAAALVKAPPARQAKLLEQMQNEKGPKYTEALALAIPQLDGEPRRLARDALADRLTRMKATVLAEYLQDDDAEIRRAAGLAVAMKESKELIPNLIPLLRDAELSVARAAHAALKELTGQDFGPSAKATREERELAASKWLQWWGKQKK